MVGRGCGEGSSPRVTLPSMSVTRDFTATAFVVWRRRVLLHRHKKLRMWLPCGGHIEPNELPDEAVKRESLEESGVAIELVGERTLPIDDPLQLVRPRGIQLEAISPGHEHIDLIYFAKPTEDYDGSLLPTDPTLGWFDAAALGELPLTEEVRHWTALALAELGTER